MEKKKDTQNRDAIINSIVNEYNKTNGINYYEYMNFLGDFTDRYSIFSSETFMYTSDDVVPKETKKNISKLQEFYSLVSTYAKENYISAGERGLYKVKYGKNGVFVSKDKIYYCGKLNDDEFDEAIELTDILLGVKRPDVDAINESLNALSCTIRSLVKNGVPREAIDDKVKESLSELLVVDANDKEKVKSK